MRENYNGYYSALKNSGPHKPKIGPHNERQRLSNVYYPSHPISLVNANLHPLFPICPTGNVILAPS